MKPFVNISFPEEQTQAYRCPCCGYLTLHGRGGYEICTVCFWEDDGQDDHDADEIRGGPNKDFSLTMARDNFKKIGVWHPQYRDNVRAPLPHEL